MGFGQGLIQNSAFLQISFIDTLPAQHDLGGFAAGGAHGFDFIGNPRSAADGEGSGSFGRSHVLALQNASARGIQQASDFGLGVCLTNTPY